MNIKLSLVLITQLISLSLLAQSPKGSLSGSVTGKDGAPVSTATIILKELNKSIPVDTRGNFSIDGLEAGTYTLILKALGTKPQEKTVSVKADKNNSISFKSVDHISELSQVTVTSYNTINDKATEVGKSGISAKDLPQSIQIIGTQAIQD